MKTSLKFKTAAVAIAATAFAISTPASAQYQSNNSGNQLLGAVIGGVAGAALGDGIAPRGQSSEYGIIGGVLGGVAGAAIAGSGNNNNRGYNNGYYNSQTGYYGSGYTQGGYYQQPVYSRPAYAQPVYSQPVYSQPAYYSQPRVVYSQPRYVTPYSGRTGTSLSINIGSGGYYGNRGFSNRYYSAPVRYRNNRGNNRRNNQRRNYRK